MEREDISHMLKDLNLFLITTIIDKKTDEEVFLVTSLNSFSNESKIMTYEEIIEKYEAKQNENKNTKTFDF